MVSHAHFTVNGRKVNIPSYLVKPGDVVEVASSSRSSAKFSKLTGKMPMVILPQWLEREKNTLKGTVTENALSARTLICPLKSISSSSCTPSNAVV